VPGRWRLKRRPAHRLRGLLLALALVASYLPAGRALSVHPAMACRSSVGMPKARHLAGDWRHNERPLCGGSPLFAGSLPATCQHRRRKSEKRRFRKSPFLRLAGTKARRRRRGGNVAIAQRFPGLCGDRSVIAANASFPRRVTATMEAGLSNHVWSLEEVAALVDRRAAAGVA